MSNIIYKSGVKFPSLIIPTGSQPLDSRTIVQNLPTNKSEFQDNAVYLGMTVSCLTDNIFYMLTDIATDGGLTWQQVGGSTVVSSYDKLIEFASEDNIGKTVYLNTEVKDGSDKTYTTGLYVVTGVGTINKLEASTVGGQDLASLSAEISSIKASYEAADTAISYSLSSYVNDLQAVDESIQDALDDHEGKVATDTEYGHVKIKNLKDKNLYTNDLSSYNDFAVDVATLLYAYNSVVDYTEEYIDSEIGKLNSSYTGIGTYVDVTVDQVSGKITNVTIDDSKIVNVLQPIEQNLTDHINGKLTYEGAETSLHLVAGEREKWNTAANRIDTFMDNEGIDGTIDTLHEISYWIAGHGSEATDLAKSIAENASYIDELKEADTAISYSLSSYVDELKEADIAIVNSLSSYVSDLQAADEDIQDALNEHKGKVATDTEYGHVKIKNLTDKNLNNYFGNDLSSYNDFAVDVATLVYAYEGLVNTIDSTRQSLKNYIDNEVILNLDNTVTSEPTTYGFVTVSITQESGKIVSANIDDSNIQSKLDEYKLDIITSYTEADTAIVNSLTSYVSALEAADAEINNKLSYHIEFNNATDTEYGHVKLADNDTINNALSGTSYTNIFDVIGTSVRPNLSSLTNNVITVGVLTNELSTIKDTINNKIESLDTSYNFTDNNSLISYSYEQVNGIITNLSISTNNVAKADDLTYLGEQVDDVKEKLNTFLGEDDGVLDTIETLQDIQEWMNTEGNAATELTTHVVEHCDLINSYVMTPKNNWVTI